MYEFISSAVMRGSLKGDFEWWVMMRSPPFARITFPNVFSILSSSSGGESTSNVGRGFSEVVVGKGVCRYFRMLQDLGEVRRCSEKSENGLSQSPQIS
jgi:hypothetical protein